MNCALEHLLPVWKVDNPMSYHDFCIYLSEQMKLYDPKKSQYPGDSSFRSSTQLPKQEQAKIHRVEDKAALEDYIGTDYSGHC
eukprot:7183733-Ditylum_brightwellii.AAC.1